MVGAEAREQFTGWIAGMGTASGCPAGDRPLAPLPCGVVTDVVVEDPAATVGPAGIGSAAGSNRRAVSSGSGRRSANTANPATTNAIALNANGPE